MRVCRFLRCIVDKQASTAGKMVDPLIFNVPVFCQRPVGRDADVITLWQNLLSGKKAQTITGLDGIGKSTVASQFCECAKKSGRFSCIQWFNGEHALEEQLREFVSAMKSRTEKEVLLVFDDVAHVESVLKLLPKHDHIYSLIVTQSADAADEKAAGAVHGLSVGPLQEKDAAEITQTVKLPGGESASDVQGLLSLLGNVPLLLTIAEGLLEAGIADTNAIAAAIRSSGAVSGDSLRVSGVCQVLVKLAVDKLSADHPSALKALAIAASLHISDLSPIIFDAAADEDASELCRKAARAGVLSHKWETDSFALHRVVANALHSLLDDAARAAVAKEAAVKLLTLWPRKARSAGSALTESLVWHSLALRNTFRSLGVEMTEELVTSLDRSASYLAVSEGRHLNCAVDMWKDVVAYFAQMRAFSAVQVEAAWNCGRTLHFMRRGEEAAEMLRHAFESASAVHGRSSAEASLILACYAPHMDASDAAAEQLLEAAKALQQPRTSAPLSKADMRMAKESTVVLLLRYSQMFREQGKEMPPAVMQQVEQLRQELLRMK